MLKLYHQKRSMSIISIKMIMQYLSGYLTMHKEVHIEMVADRIKFLRESNNMTQSDLARQLGITRSSVNAWEQGISVPSTQYVVELARLFNVSADYLLGVDASANLNITGLNEDDVKLVYQIVNHLRKNNSKTD